MAPPAPENPAQMAIARPRSAGGKVAASSDRVPGMTMAPPTPMTARAMMTWVASPATVATRVPMAKTSSPPCSSRRRPSRSPIAPIGRSRPANTSA